MSVLEELLTKYTAKGANIFPGVVLSAINRDGKTLYSRSSGFTSPDPKSPPITIDNTLHVASFTKLLTSISALQCVERGQITLDEPLSKVLPELSLLKVLKRNEGENKETEPFLFVDAASTPTLRQLLTHSSGIGYDVMPPLLEWRQSRGETPTGPFAPSQYIVDCFSTPYLFQPGESYAYGAGLDWAGLLVARLNETTLEEYMEANMFTPLNLTSTTFHLENKPGITDRLVPIMQRQPDGTLSPHYPDGPPPAVDEKGGAGAFSSVPDYMAVLSDLLKPNPTLLNKQSADLLFTPQFDDNSPQQTALAAAVLKSYPGMGFLPEKGNVNVGLGGDLMAEDTEAGDTVFKAGTMTWGGAFNTVWFCNRLEGVAACFGSQVYPPGGEETVKLVRAFINEVWRLAKAESEA